MNAAGPSATTRNRVLFDMATARAWLRTHLPEQEPVEIDSEDVLDRAAAVLTRRA